MRALQYADLDARLTIQQRFQIFHDLNPWVLTELERMAKEYIGQRLRRRCGIGMLWETLRYQYGITTGDDFKLNNDFRSRYVRLMLERHPEWANNFETRVLRAA